MLRTLISCLCLIGLVSLIRPAQAAGADIVITWQSDTYVPADFAGKILPTGGSEILVSAALIANGQAADLSTRTVNWYVNDAFAGGGRGRDTITLTAPEVPGAVWEVRAEVPDFPGGEAVNTVLIPVRAPEVVIDSPYPNRAFSDSAPVFKARPFFFNVKSSRDLEFSWKANGRAAAADSDPEVLKVEVLPGTPRDFKLFLELAVSNPASILEQASGRLDLTYLP